MKIQDLINGHLPHLFLDMDGVQADFFGAWAAHHNVPSYKDIADPEEAINRLAASGPEAVYTFFRKLDPLPGGMRVVHWLRQNQIAYTVLSAPLRGEPHAAIRGKKDWLDQHNPGTSQNAIFTSKKFAYAVTHDQPNVLVDDFGKYLLSWKEAGGIAVKHDEHTADQTIAMLEKIYLGA